MPMVKSRESKTRSKEGILPSFRISKHESVRRQNIFPDFIWLGKQTRYLHVSSSFRPFPRALSICFHVICPVLRTPAVSSVHTPRCSHQCSPHPLPWLRISLRSRPQSSRRASCADPKRRAGASEAPSSCRRAPAGHLRTDGNEHVSSVRTNGFELYGRRSPRRSISPAARRHAHASACSQFIRADQRGHWPWPWRRLSGSMLRIGAERPFCTWLANHALAADTCRAARARYSSGR